MTTKTFKPHTPGPWNTLRYPEDPSYIGNWFVAPVSDKAGFYTIATLAIRGDETEANARLIAAAPELLEALEDLLAACVANHLPGCPEIDDAQHYANQVIAKATGN